MLLYNSLQKHQNNQDITVTSSTGSSGECRQNAFGVQSNDNYGGRYPAVTFNRDGNMKSGQFVTNAGLYHVLKLGIYFFIFYFLFFF